MFKKNSAVYLFLILLIILNSVLIGADSNRESDQSYFEGELRLTRILSDKYNEDPEKSIFQISSIDTDSKGNIYVLDHGRNKVLKYDKDGNFILSWGRKGHGPGEFDISSGSGNNQIRINSKDEVFIFSISKAQIFDSEGQFKKEFAFLSPRNIDVDQNGNFYKRKKLEISLEKPIVTIKDGKTLSGFGELPLNDSIHKIKIDPAILAMHFEMMLKIVGNSVYAVYQSYPVIQKYSLDGKLIWEKTIPFNKISYIDDKLKNFLEKRQNPREMKFKSAQDFPMRVALTQIGIASLDDELFVTMYIGKIILLRFDDKGNLLSTYTLDPRIVTGLEELDLGLTVIKLNKANKRALIFKGRDCVLYEAEFVKNKN